MSAASQLRAARTAVAAPRPVASVCATPRGQVCSIATGVPSPATISSAPMRVAWSPWRHCQALAQFFVLAAQRFVSPVISSSRPSANEDFPLPLRPTTIVSPGCAGSSSVAGGPMPRKPSTVTDFRYTSPPGTPASGASPSGPAAARTFPRASSSSSDAASRASSRERSVGSMRAGVTARSSLLTPLPDPSGYFR